MEGIYRLLRVGGTAGVIVPQGVLFGSGKAFVAARKLLVEACELKAVIAMPSGVFKPYAGVSTAVLVFTKGGATEKVWFYDMRSDGYSLDDKRDKIPGSYGDLQDIVTRFLSRKEEPANDRNSRCFTVSKEEIIAEKYDLSIGRYKREIFEDVSYEPPAAILTKLETLEGEIGKGIAELKEMVG